MSGWRQGSRRSSQQSRSGASIFRNAPCPDGSRPRTCRRPSTCSHGQPVHRPHRRQRTVRQPAHEHPRMVSGVVHSPTGSPTNRSGVTWRSSKSSRSAWQPTESASPRCGPRKSRQRSPQPGTRSTVAAQGWWSRSTGRRLGLLEDELSAVRGPRTPRRPRATRQASAGAGTVARPGQARGTLQAIRPRI
jgi:hypothetical protein